MRAFLLLLGIILAFNSQSQIITTVAGNGSSSYSGDSITATSASIGTIACVIIDKLGNYYFSDRLNSRIRKVDICSGIIYTVAGNHIQGYSGDGGQATSAQLNNPIGIALDDSGNLYISDFYNNRIRKVDSLGIITTIAGTGTAGFSGDGGNALSAMLNGPQWVALDHIGNLYINDMTNYRIRKINPTGIITTVAGNGTNGFSGDGGNADSAELSAGCYGLAVDISNNLYVADELNYRVRKLNVATGIISTVAGTGPGAYSGDGMPATASKVTPFALCFDSQGNLYIGDFNERIRKVDTSGIITTVVGIGVSGFSGDGGPADSAKIRKPEGLAFDAHGNLYFADCQNYRVRKVKYSVSDAPIISLSGISAATIGSTVNVTASVAGSGSGYSIQWFNKGAWFATTTVPTVTYTKTMSVDSITAKVFGCSDSALSGVHVVVLSNRTGLSSPTSGERVTCYPNPVNGELYIDGAVVFESVSITNFLGQVVHSVAEYGELECVVNTSALPAGMYFVRVGLAGGGVGISRFVKQ